MVKSSFWKNLKHSLIHNWDKYALIFILIISIIIPLLSVSIHREFRWDVEPNLFYSAFLETQDLNIYEDYFNSYQKTPGAIWILTPIVSVFGGSFVSLFAFSLLLTLIIISYSSFETPS